MKNYIFLFLNIVFLFYCTSCKVKQRNWSNSLFKEQSMYSKYFAEVNNRFRLQMLQDKAVIHFLKNNCDTIYLIERIYTENSMGGESYIWCKNKTDGLMYHEILKNIVPPDKVYRKIITQNINLNSIDTNLFNISRNFGEIDDKLKSRLLEHQPLDGHAIYFFSWLVKGKLLKTVSFNEFIYYENY